MPYHELHGLSSLQWWLYILCWWSREERFTAAEKSGDDVAVGRHCVQSGRDDDVDVDVTYISSNTSRSQYDNTHTHTDTEVVGVCQQYVRLVQACLDWQCGAGRGSGCSM